MKQKMILGIPLFTLIFNQVSYGLTLSIPRGNADDVNIKNTQIWGNPDTVLNTISFINEYLWFTIWFLCFIFLIYNGIKIISARGNNEIFKKARGGLVWSGIGIAICILSYSFVRVIVNLF